VCSYSVWMNGLPKFELPFLSNYAYYTLNFPSQLSVVMQSLGFAAVIMFVALFLVIFIICYFFAQICLCGKKKKLILAKNIVEEY